MKGARLFLVLSASVVVGVGFSACGGKVVGDSDGDAGVDTAPTTTSTPTTKPTTTSAPACPSYRPISGTACTKGLSCFYACTGAYPTSVRASCPGGTWVSTAVESCPSMPPPMPTDCESCQKTYCSSEINACQASDAALKGCNALITCINSCSDDACANKCITDSTSVAGKELVACIYDKCIDACGG